MKRLLKKYGRENKSPKGKYHCSTPDGCIQKWSIVENIGPSVFHGGLYIVIGFTTENFIPDIKNSDGSFDGYLVLRIPFGMVETVLPKDWVKFTGYNVKDMYDSDGLSYSEKDFKDQVKNNTTHKDGVASETYIRGLINLELEQLENK